MAARGGWQGDVFEQDGDDATQRPRQGHEGAPLPLDPGPPQGLARDDKDEEAAAAQAGVAEPLDEVVLLGQHALVQPGAEAEADQFVEEGTDPGLVGGVMGQEDVGEVGGRIDGHGQAPEG